MTQSAKLDEFDRRILAVMQQDASISHVELGARIGLSPSSARRRVEAMRRSGVIRAIVAVVDPALLEAQVRFFVTVTFEAETPGGYEAFKSRIVTEPRVRQCFVVSGQFDIVLLVSAASTADYWNWAEHTLTADPSIRRFDSFVVWSTLKS
jgi:Lrp/AsnC family transcriptional regulator, leucine-responsive regulatory protein